MKPIIVANWKANKTRLEAEEWVKQTKDVLTAETEVEIVICPSFPLLTTLQEAFKNTSVKIGAQNVSKNGLGAYTGEVPAVVLRDYVTHCLVGHSERRKYFGENDQQVGEKIEQLIAANITPVLCVSDLKQLDSYLSTAEVFKKNKETIIFAYEPPGAISGGGDYRPETPQSAQDNALEIKSKIGSEIRVLYGGSVNPENIKDLVSQKDISGVLPGKASLDPNDFLQLVKNAKT